MRLYRDRAVVLRQHKLGEADRIVTLLTRDHGLVRAVAKGVRRTRSKFGARLEPFAHIDAQLHPGRNLDIVTQVVSIDAFATDIVSDYGRYTCGCAMLETAERLAGEAGPAPDLHRLTVSALRAVADGRRSRDLLLDAYLLRAMGIAGWAPALTECARCATPGPHRAFHVGAGGSVCTHCRPAGSTTPPPGVLDLMSALHDGDWEFADKARNRTAATSAGWWPPTCSGIWNGSSKRCHWWNGRITPTAPSPNDAQRLSSRTVASKAERRGVRRLPAATARPDDYPVFPSGRRGRSSS